MIPKTLPLLFILCFTYMASNFAQEIDTISHLLDQGLNNASWVAMDSYLTKTRKPKAIEGSLYLNERWQESLLLTPQNKVIKVPARYRVYDDEVQILFEGEVMKLFPDSIKAIKIKDQVFLSLPYSDGKEKKRSYFELLSEGTVDLFLHRKMEIVKSDYNPALNLGQRNDELVIKEYYYYRKKSGTLRPMKQTKGGVLEALSNRKKAVAQFAKSNKLGVRKRSDLVAIFDFYNRN